MLLGPISITEQVESLYQTLSKDINLLLGSISIIEKVKILCQILSKDWGCSRGKPYTDLFQEYKLASQLYPNYWVDYAYIELIIGLKLISRIQSGSRDR